MSTLADTSTDLNASSHAEGHHDDHHDHHDQGFLKTYVFSTDHKVIGVQYALTAMVFLVVGFFLMMMMRWSIAFPGQPIPVFGELLKIILPQFCPEGVLGGDAYNMFGAMHGTIMVFLGIVPLGFGAFGNFVTPLQIGAPDMAFPKLNMWSYWLFLVGGLFMMASFFLPTGAARTGWTNYSPLATTTDLVVKNVWMTGQTWWLLAMVLIISSSLLGSVNVITTIVNLRAKGLSWMRLPFFVWAMLVTAFILLLAFPPLEVAALMQLSDRVFGSSFFLPTGLVDDAGRHFEIAGGGSAVLYQHLFWFLGHPEVYVLILPAIAIVAEVLPNNTRRPLWGYKTMVYSAVVLGFTSFIVWAHHMYLTGMGPFITTFFQITTVMVSIPSVLLLTCLMISLWGGSIRFTVPMLWASAFIPMFGIGGLTGLPLAFSAIDLHLHDTYYVIGHFHYVVAPGTIFAFFAGIYFWYPKITGRRMGDFLGHLHFWPSLLFMNVLFFPMLYQGMAGFHRRWWDGGDWFSETSKRIFIDNDSFLGNLICSIFSGGHPIRFIDLNELMSYGAWGLAIAQLPFVFNLFLSITKGRKITSDNPWDATTLEWNTPTPPPHGNFASEPVAYRNPYEYSVPGAEKDFVPQWETPKDQDKA